MAIRRAKPIDPSAPKPPPRAQVEAIVRRYLKPDQTPNWRQEMPLAYGLLKAYPSVAFWTHHELSFALNSLAWFLTEQGKAQLASDWTVFHWNPPSDPSSTPQADAALDTTPQPAYTVPYTPSAARPRTVAEFLKTP